MDQSKMFLAYSLSLSVFLSLPLITHSLSTISYFLCNFSKLQAMIKWLLKISILHNSHINPYTLFESKSIPSVFALFRDLFLFCLVQHNAHTRCKTSDYRRFRDGVLLIRNNCYFLHDWLNGEIRNWSTSKKSSVPHFTISVFDNVKLNCVFSEQKKESFKWYGNCNVTSQYRLTYFCDNSTIICWWID